MGEIRFRYTVLCSWGPDWDRKQKPTQLCNPEFSVENKPADAQKAKLNFWLSAQPPSTMGSLKNITNPRVVIVMVPKEMLASSYHQSDLNLPWLAAESTLRLHWLYKVVCCSMSNLVFLYKNKPVFANCGHARLWLKNIFLLPHMVWTDEGWAGVVGDIILPVVPPPNPHQGSLSSLVFTRRDPAGTMPGTLPFATLPTNHHWCWCVLAKLY